MRPAPVTITVQHFSWMLPLQPTRAIIGSSDSEVAAPTCISSALFRYRQYVASVDGVALSLSLSLSLVSVIAHRHQKDSLSLSAFSRRLAPLSGGVWSHSLCLVRVPSIRSIRTRTRQRKRDQTLPPLSLEHSLTTSVAIISSVWSGPVRYG